MDRNKASKLLRDELNIHGLNEWGVRLSTNINEPWLGICLHKDKVIVLNAHHVDIHPDLEVICTIKHEVGHALTPGHGHDEVWANKAKEIGIELWRVAYFVFILNFLTCLICVITCFF